MKKKKNWEKSMAIRKIGCNIKLEGYFFMDRCSVRLLWSIQIRFHCIGDQLIDRNKDKQHYIHKNLDMNKSG